VRPHPFCVYIVSFAAFAFFAAKTGAQSPLKLPFLRQNRQKRSAPLGAFASLCVYIVSFAAFAFFAAKTDASILAKLPFLHQNSSKHSAFLRVSA